MRDTELYQKLLGLTVPWRVRSAELKETSRAGPLGELTVTVEWPRGELLRCPDCGAVVPGHDTRPRHWRHPNTTQWKTFIEADVARVNCRRCGVKQVRVAWAEDGSRFTELFEAYAIQVLQAVRSTVQVQCLMALPWDQIERIMKRAVGRGHDYVSVLHDLTERRVLEVVPERTRAATESL